MNKFNLIHPAHLFIGENSYVFNYIQDILRSIFCKDYSKCKNCINCNLLDQKQHYGVRYISPENGYKLEDLEIVFDTIKFALNSEEKIFFILQKADLLNLACANKLLKLLEEPPLGYYFILIASNKESVLPTIYSRCLIYNIESTLINNFNQELLNFFIKNNDIYEFGKYLDKLKITDIQARYFVEELRAYFVTQLSQNTNSDELFKKLDIISDFYHKLPMPGSGKLFIRSLYLRLL